MLVLLVIIVLTILGMSLMQVSFGVRHNAIAVKQDVAALAAAEAGHEMAVFWMSQQQDLMTVLQNNPGGLSDPAAVASMNAATTNYRISFHDFFNNRPVYNIESIGTAGNSRRMINTYVMQAIGGWDSTHRVPRSANTTTPWPFASSEVIDIPLHINKHDDSPDVKDIYIIGSPSFLRHVEFGESRGSKYSSSVLNLFGAGYAFDQPDNKVTNLATVQRKVNRFRDTIIHNGRPADFVINPTKSTTIPGTTQPVVQLEFFVNGGVGKMRVTNNCTAVVYQGSDGARTTYDYKIDPAGSGSTFVKYPIYGYHYRNNSGGSGVVYDVADSYVKMEVGGIYSEPGGQVYVDGNVVIGGQDYDQMVLKGKLTVVATGNIWVADPIVFEGNRTGDLPAMDNPNALGLIALGVVKVVDPGMPTYSYVTNNGSNGPKNVSGFTYVPVANHDSGADYRRILTNPMVVEAAVTVAGGGWGAENVGNRKNVSSYHDKLVLRGAIAEAMRGIVGTASPLWSSYTRNGYYKQYYMDERLWQGILPGDFWLLGKYVSVPGGWYDQRIYQ